MKNLIGIYFPKKYLGPAPEPTETVELAVVGTEPLYCLVCIPPDMVSLFMESDSPIQVSFGIDERQQAHYASHMPITHCIAEHILELAGAADISQWAE